MSSTRSFFSRFKNAVTENLSSATDCIKSLANKKIVRLPTYFVMAAISQLLDTACDQKMKNASLVEYYNEVPSRIVWLIFSSLVMGINIEFVTQTLLADRNREDGPRSNNISAKKILITCTTVYGGCHFIQKSLSTPITSANVIYILGSTAINSLSSGILTTGGGYFLQKFNYSILPFTRKHVTLISIGIALSVIEELLDYMCQQMIDHNDLQWESLTSPKRLLALHVFDTIVQGLFYGISLCNLKKYSTFERPEEEQPFLKIRNIILGMSIVSTSISIFIKQALTVPIHWKNAGFIIADSLATGIPFGLALGSTSYTMGKLQVNYVNDRGLPERKEPLLSRQSFIGNSISRDNDVQAENEYRPPSLAIN
jgi:uncharacterized protein with PQ loop repeat